MLEHRRPEHGAVAPVAEQQHGACGDRVLRRDARRVPPPARRSSARRPSTPAPGHRRAGSRMPRRNARGTLRTPPAAPGSAARRRSSGRRPRTRRSTQASTAAGRSASSKTTTGALPPSSIASRLSPAPRAMASPVAKPPVNDTIRISRTAMSACARWRSPCTTVTISSGTPASTRRSTRNCAVSGVNCGGLQDDRVAGRDGRAELVRDEVERVVVGGDREDDAERLPREPAAPVLGTLERVERDHLAGVRPRRLGRERERGDRTTHLFAGLADGLARPHAR